MDFHILWEVIRALLDTAFVHLVVEIFVDFILAIIVGAVFLLFMARASMRLIHGTLDCSWYAAVKELFKSYCHALLRVERVYLSTRKRIEYELLHPRPIKKFREEEKKYCERLDDWRTYEKELREDLSSHRGKPPVITVETCFDLHNTDQEKIQRYFDALKAEKGLEEDEKGRFLCSVKVKTGFVAPLHLLTGLLARFDQDWVRVIDGYGNSVTWPDDPLPLDCRKLQTFLFDCWMLWGPSVPLCQCENWEGGNAIQYGFGDENNSIPLFFTDDTKLTNVLTPKEVKANLAFSMEVTGRPRSGLRTKEVCPAQQSICDADRYGFVLEYEDHKSLQGGLPKEHANRYYSGYAWIMFVLLDEHGRPLIQKKEERWRNLFPFFEHTNIADRETYELMKDQLVRKALTGISHIVRKEASATWRLAYACALDDSGCGSSLPFPLHGDPIKDKLRKLLDLGEFLNLRKSRKPGKPEPILVENKPYPLYSACHLPEILDDYYIWLKSLEQPHRG